MTKENLSTLVLPVGTGLPSGCTPTVTTQLRKCGSKLAAKPHMHWPLLQEPNKGDWGGVERRRQENQFQHGRKGNRCQNVESTP